MDHTQTPILKVVTVLNFKASRVINKTQCISYDPQSHYNIFGLKYEYLNGLKTMSDNRNVCIKCQ
jgi:hypothetical protein